MGRYLFVLIPLLVVVIGAWMVTSAHERRAASERAKGAKASRTRRVEPYRSPLPIVAPRPGESTTGESPEPGTPPDGETDPPREFRRAYGDPVDAEMADRDLERFATLLRSRRAITEEILAALDAVSAAYHGLTPPPPPVLEDVPDDADEETKEAIERRNKALLDAHTIDLKKFERAAEKFRKNAIKLFLKALKLQKINKNTESNLRDPVNVKAATLLGQTGEPRVAPDLIHALEKTIFKANYEVPQPLLEEVFNAIATLNQPKSLEWMINEFTHSKMSPTEEVDRLKAAHKSMILFTDVPGKLRYWLVAEMQKTYAAVESQARQSSNDPKIRVVKEFWDSIKTDVIKAVQHFSGNPTDDDGEFLDTMEAFVVWFRQHKNVRRAPWADR